MNNINKVAILIDGGFYSQRFKKLNKKPPTKKDIENLIDDVMGIVSEKPKSNGYTELLRSYYYDCLPFGKEIPKFKGKGKIDFSKSKSYDKLCRYIDSLKEIDQFALRLGELSFSGWKLNPYKPEDKPIPDFRQKGVDMKIGLDVAWIASRKSVNKIVLVTGDSDFISPIKLARREGILIYLYSMKNTLKRELIEHTDFII